MANKKCSLRDSGVDHGATRAQSPELKDIKHIDSEDEDEGRVSTPGDRKAQFQAVQHLQLDSGKVRMNVREHWCAYLLRWYWQSSFNLCQHRWQIW
jgi:hypothetical protein